MRVNKTSLGTNRNYSIVKTALNVTAKAMFGPFEMALGLSQNDLLFKILEAGSLSKKLLPCLAVRMRTLLLRTKSLKDSKHGIYPFNRFPVPEVRYALLW